MKHGLTFTIYHGLVASLAIHAALAAPFVLPNWNADPDESERLVVEFKGVTATDQVEEKVAQETKGEETQDKVEATKPEPSAPSQEPQPDEKEMPVEKEAERPAPSEASVAAQRPTETKTGEAGTNNVVGVTERQEAQTIRADPVTEEELLRNYVRGLSKKVQANLAYPDNARDAGLKGGPFVSFTVLPDGRIRPETLKVATSSGKPKLDAAALKTITASAPFDPPPREMTITVEVVYGEMGKNKS
jgi:protein TonB